VLSTGAVRELTDPLTQEYEAFRPRDLSGDEVASLCMDAGSAPLRRGGSKTGVVGVWALWVEGRKVWLPLSPAKSESSESGLAGLRDVVKRGLQPRGDDPDRGGPRADHSP
jgi:transposase-like protein